jgi:polyisoprenyl-teichoic acid--peptidoglycan teichoic acid transferase
LIILKSVRSSIMFRRLLLIVAFVSLLPISCNLPSSPGMSAPPQEIGSIPVFVRAPEDATSTPTPFMPVAPTPTYLPTDFPTPLPTATNVPDTPTPEPTFTATPGRAWEDFLGPTVWPDIDIPTPAPLFQQPKGQVNIVLLGSDQRQGTGGFRTDTLMLVTINPKAGIVSMTSFPRDLYVYIPGWTINRINTAFPRGGFPMLQDTFEYNFGVRPDYYALVNFWTFTSLIDNLGGITVHVGATLTDQRSGYGEYTIYRGQVIMDGDTALWYVRSRYSTSDFDRTRRQQEVVRAIFYKLLNINAIARAPQLYDTYKRSVSTNMALEYITPLLPVAAGLTDSANIKQYFIGTRQVTPWRNNSGAAVLLPNRNAILEIMKQSLNVQ